MQTSRLLFCTRSILGPSDLHAPPASPHPATYPALLAKSRSMEEPLVSLIIPTYDRAQFLRDTLESAVNQTYEHLDIVVMDDASSDETPEVVQSVEDERIRYIRQSSNRGPNENWRAGMEAARGEFFAFLADDDVLESKFVECLLAPLRQHKALICSFCDHWVMNVEGERQPDLTDKNSRAYARHDLSEGPLDDFAQVALIDEAIYIGAVLFRRGGVPPSFLPPEAHSAMGGWILYNCVKTGRTGYYVPERLMQCRWQEGSVSRSQQWLGSITEGNLNRYQIMLDDPELEAYHSDIQGDLATMLSVRGRMHLKRGEYRAARRELVEALQIRLDFGDILSLPLAYMGRAGSYVAQMFRRVR